MKKIFLLFFSFLIYGATAQDTTRILFIGNSFTFFNNMPDMVKAFGDSAGRPIITGMHAPGGVSVGDIAQGTMAHMNNPALFSLIRSRKWDFAVIQDNQGRFVRDSAVFPATSLVMQGHLNIMDSVKANNSCVKIILFAGWAWKAGMPPFGNTGIETIQRILVNYRVLNDTMKETIAPIGEAWIKAVNYLPSVNLWDPDDAHPGYPGSYLTAAVIFSTIFNLPSAGVDYNGTLLPAVAGTLRSYSDSVLFKPSNHPRYNLGGIKKVMPQNTGGQISVPGTFASYRWYKDNVFVGTTPVIAASGNGTYRAELQEADNCIVKSCLYRELATALNQQDLSHGIRIFPNPSDTKTVTIDEEQVWTRIELYNSAGVKEKITVEDLSGLTAIHLGDLRPGYYILQLTTASGVYREKLVVTE